MVAKRKTMTIAQKKERAAIKKDLQDRGILPPHKKPLNRKKFAVETLDAIENEGFNYYSHLTCLIQAIGCMIPHREDGKIVMPVTAEEIGVLKVLRIALEYKRFWEQKTTEGITEATIEEIYKKSVKPIIDL